MKTPASDVGPPTPDVEVSLAYLLSKQPAGWRLDEKVERALIEAECLKWPGLPLPHAMIDFLEYWTIIRKPQARPTSTQGWRQAWRNWCRIERERAEARDAGTRGHGDAAKGPGQHRTSNIERRTAVATEQEAREAIASLKDRFGWDSSARQPISPSAPEEET
jgi:hypothetical protein